MLWTLCYVREDGASRVAEGHAIHADELRPRAHRLWPREMASEARAREAVDVVRGHGEWGRECRGMRRNLRVRRDREGTGGGRGRREGVMRVRRGRENRRRVRGRQGSGRVNSCHRCRGRGGGGVRVFVRVLSHALVRDDGVVAVFVRRVLDHLQAAVGEGDAVLARRLLAVRRLVVAEAAARFVVVDAVRKHVVQLRERDG